MSLAEVAPGFVRSGKVRDIYALDDERLLLVASDRISAFDVVLPTPIPDKGRVLTGLARYWFRETERAGIMPNHLLTTAVAGLPGEFAVAADELRGRATVPANSHVGAKNQCSGESELCPREVEGPDPPTSAPAKRQHGSSSQRQFGDRE